MAYGSGRYLRQAYSLAASLDHNAPGIHRTLITDQAGRLSAHARFDAVVALLGPSASDCRPKLDLDLCSPYQQTIYIDSDSLVMRPLQPVFDLLAEHDFIVTGKNVTDGRWYGSVTEMCRLAGSESMPQFNGGLLAFNMTARTRRVFAHARKLADRYDALGFDRFNGGIADEPLLAIALAAEGIGALDLTSTVMATPIGISTSLIADILSGECHFEKRGRYVSPAIVHFASDFSSRAQILGAIYRRECLKLTLARRMSLPASVARVVSTAMHGLACWRLNRRLRQERCPT